MHEPMGRVQFCSNWKILQVLINTKVHSKSCCYFLIIYMKKASQTAETDEILTAHAICSLHSCYNTAIVLHALVFSLSDMRSCFHIYN